MTTPHRYQPPPSGLQRIAESISSASDPDLAAWQERAIQHPRSQDGVLVWCVGGVSVCAGLLILGAGAWFVVRPTMTLPVMSSGSRRLGGGWVMLAAFGASVVAGAALAFALFQGGCRAAFVLSRRGRP